MPRCSLRECYSSTKQDAEYDDHCQADAGIIGFFVPVDDNPFIVSGMDMADAAAHVCIDFVLIVLLQKCW
jgi:hypothetical protein